MARYRCSLELVHEAHLHSLLDSIWPTWSARGTTARSKLVCLHESRVRRRRGVRPIRHHALLRPAAAEDDDKRVAGEVKRVLEGI